MTNATPLSVAHLESMTPFERIEHELASIEWGDRIRDPLGWCPDCGRTEGYERLHAYGCAIRTIRDQLAKIPEIYFS